MASGWARTEALKFVDPLRGIESMTRILRVMFYDKCSKKRTNRPEETEREREIAREREILAL